jgi:hypothetical protein
MKTSVALALAVVCALAQTAPAGAAEPAAKPRPGDPIVMLDPVGLPVVADGRIVNYVFVTVKLDLSPKADLGSVEAKAPFVRDALVRAGGGAAFVRRDTYTALDEDRIRAVALQAARAVAGPGAVVAAEVVRQQPQHDAVRPAPPGLKH